MTPPTLTRHADRDALLDAAGPWLEAHEAEHNLLLGLLAKLPPASGQFFAHVSRGDAIELVAVLAPPRGVIFSRAASLDGVPLVLDALRDAGVGALPTAAGPPDVVSAFADRWRSLTGAVPRYTMNQRIYALTELVAPRPTPGHLRVATADDLALVTDWIVAFAADAAVPAPQGAAMRSQVDQGMAEGRFFLWDDGGPVSMAGTARVTKHGAVVSSVYTPPSLRGRGYASSCVAAWSARQLAAGRRFCCLYADLANPTSNGIYQAMGYTPVADAAFVAYDAP
jgi:predicted GNAT family acetyltransferase